MKPRFIIEWYKILYLTPTSLLQSFYVDTLSYYKELK